MALDQDSAAASRKAGQQLFGAGQLEEARRCFEDALRHSPEDPDVMHYLGATMVQLGRADEGISLLERSIAHRPSSHAALNSLGNAYQLLARFEEALERYTRALALKPDYVPAHLNRARAFEGLERWAKAADAYGNALSLEPDLPGAALRLANVLRILGQYDHALNVLNKELTRAGRDADTHNMIGCVYGAKRDVQKAIDHFTAAITANPLHTAALLNLGKAFGDQELFDESACAFRCALDTTPNHVPTVLALAYTMERLKKLDDAAALYERALALEPDNDTALALLTHCRAEMCDWTRIPLARLRNAARKSIYSGEVLPLLSLFDDPVLHLGAARARTASLTQLPALFPARPARAPARRLSVGRLPRACDRVLDRRTLRASRPGAFRDYRDLLWARSRQRHAPAAGERL